VECGFRVINFVFLPVTSHYMDLLNLVLWVLKVMLLLLVSLVQLLDYWKSSDLSF